MFLHVQQMVRILEKEKEYSEKECSLSVTKALLIVEASPPALPLRKTMPMAIAQRTRKTVVVLHGTETLWHGEQDGTLQK